MHRMSFQLCLRLLVLISVISGLATSSAHAATLLPETVKAWNAYVKMTEQRIAVEQASAGKFLALDFQNGARAARDRQNLLSGEIQVKQVESLKSIEVPGGMIHHWRGGIFIPQVTLDFVLSRVENPTAEYTKQEDVLDCRVLERMPGQLKLYLKLQRSKIVTVLYNTEHQVRYQRLGQERAYSSSVATRIAEIERLPDNQEREKPEGSDRGYLWRLNSYWRYQQVNGGVIVECESLTLSRSVPLFLEYIIRPLVNRVARESMSRTLQSMRTRIVRANRPNPAASDS
jgi:hypothetical protein